MSEYEFPYLAMLYEEIQHCVELDQGKTSELSPDEQKHVQAFVDRYNLFFKGNAHTLAVRTFPEIPLNNHELKSFSIIKAFESLNWKSLAKQLRLKLELPYPTTCIEHFFGRPFPIMDEQGNVSINIIGCVIFAKQCRYNNNDSIMFEVSNLCTSPQQPDKVQIFNSTAQFMLSCHEGEVEGFSRTGKDAEWQVFNYPTAECLAFMQVIVLLMLHQVNNAKGYQSNCYELT